MSVNDCERVLRATAAQLQPVLDPLGFEFQVDQRGVAHQPFAAGFFVREGVKVGLIYRARDTFGAVVYENEVTNVSHDDLMSWLGFTARQRLRYIDSSMTSVAAEGDHVIDALRADLETLVPILADQQTLSRAIVEARRTADRAQEEAAANKSAKLQEWLARRRAEKE
jgi:hypothetical protein